MITYGTPNADITCPETDTFHLVRNSPLKAAKIENVDLTVHGGTYTVSFTTPLGISTKYELSNPSYSDAIYDDLAAKIAGAKDSFSNVKETVDVIRDQIGGVPLMIETIIEETRDSVVLPEIPDELPEIEIPEYKPSPEMSLSELRQIALDDINKYRTQNGLGEVSLGSAVSPQLYSEELLQEGCIHHISDRGEGPMLRYRNNGDAMFLVAENIAGGLGTSWMSPQESIIDGNYRMMFDDADSNWGHRDNILNPSHRSVSIGIAYDYERLVMVQDFESVLPAGYQYHPSSFERQAVDARSCW